MPVDEMLWVDQDQKFDIQSVMLWHPVHVCWAFKFSLKCRCLFLNLSLHL